jgi:UDP-N-acetylmuramoylalanine--D-glutamate ligase
VPLETQIKNLNSVKSFVILGFAKTAIATAKFLLENFQGKEIKISELKEENCFDLELIRTLKEQGIIFEFGKQSKDFIFAKDNFIIISPGIPPASSIIQELFHSQLNYATDFDIFSMLLTTEQNYCAVTGTNGKTTCTSLIAEIFNSPALGNIGKPFLEFKEDFFPNFACELSSFQLFYSQHFQKQKIPKVSVFLNFSNDHLDWHSSQTEYFDTKTKLFCESQQEENFWLLNFDDPKVKNFGINHDHQKNSKTKICFFSDHDISYTLSEHCPFVAYLKHDRLYIGQHLKDNSNPSNNIGIVSHNSHDELFLEIPLCKTTDLEIVGKHNHINALAASLSAYLMGFDIEYIIEKITRFKAVAHRLEFVREINHNKIYNDSKATNPDSALKALEALDHAIIIIGGKEKNLDLNEFLHVVSKKSYAVIAIGEIKNKIYDKLRELNFDKIRRADSLDEAFAIALMYAQNNNYPILFSPASSSFDMFKNYEDRGNQFREIVLKY